MDYTPIVQIVTFIVLLYVLYRLGRDAIGTMLATRAAQIGNSLSVAAGQMTQASTIEQDIARQREEALVEARAIVAAGRNASGRQKELLLEQAQADAELIERRTSTLISREHRVAMDNLRREASRLALHAGSRVSSFVLAADTSLAQSVNDRTIGDVGGVV